MNNGLFEANLGGNIYKKRISYGNKRKRAGARTIIAFQATKKAFFIYGFTKNNQANLKKNEENALKELSKIYFNFNDKEIKKAIESGELVEVINEKINP